jgi:hypothetical protein
MKFTKSTLFFIILAVVLLSTLGFNIKEGLTNQDGFWKERDGLKKNELESGSEDLYVLKSSIVPPVCPKCPQRSACPRQKPCPACPPCGRCPEPAFTCKKVPNYSAAADYLPVSWSKSKNNANKGSSDGVMPWLGNGNGL